MPRSAACFETAFLKCLVELSDDVGLSEHHIERIASLLTGRPIKEAFA